MKSTTVTLVNIDARLRAASPAERAVMLQRLRKLLRKTRRDLREVDAALAAMRPDTLAKSKRQQLEDKQIKLLRRARECLRAIAVGVNAGEEKR